MENFLTSIPAFIFALGIIVFVHEFGHHIVAKMFGVRVLVFSLGFGKRLFGFQHGGTEYRISVLPLGGYVRMGGELPEESTGDPGEFLSKPRWQRILVYLAGPAMNVVLAVVLIAAVFMHGISVQGLKDVPAVVGYVGEDSPAEAAGLLPEDRIVSVDGESMSLWTDVDFKISTSPEKPLTIEFERDGISQSTELVPNKMPREGLGDAGFFPKLQLRMSVINEGFPADRAGFLSGDAVLKVNGTAISNGQEFVDLIEPAAGQTLAIEILRGEQVMTLDVVPDDVDGVGKIGVALGVFRQLPLGEALVESIQYNIDIVDKSLQILGKLFTREIAAKSALSGPIEIANYSGRAARQGFDVLIFMMGFLSISIGIMNLLPIPILDGGHIAILLVESVMRRDLSITIKERFAQVGFMILMTLMAVVIFFDLSKNLPALFGG